jgi:hypothetical protein
VFFVQIVSIVPQTWPVASLSSFLGRSLRRNVHASFEGKILKAITAGQNLQVKDDSWEILRDAGYYVEEADEDAQDPGSGDTEVVEEVFYEKHGLGVELVATEDFDEKTVLNGAQWADDEVGT